MAGAESTPPATPTKTPHTTQTSHFFSPSSTPRALFPQTGGHNAPMVGGDVAQMHAIMQLQAQMLVSCFLKRIFENFQKKSDRFSDFRQSLSAASSPMAQPREQHRDSALLAYQMGERMGALGKMEDAQRETLQRLQSEGTRFAAALSESAADLRAAEIELAHQKDAYARLLDQAEKQAGAIEKLNAASADVKKELAFRALQQQQTETAGAAERKTLLRSIEDCQSKVTAAAQQQAVLEQEHKRVLDDVKQLQKSLAAARTEFADSLKLAQSELQGNVGAQKALKIELNNVRASVTELAARQQNDATAAEARSTAQFAQQQRQLSALQADIRTIAATSGAPVGGFYSLLLALAMPFVSPERLVGLVSAIGRGFQSIAEKRPLRRLWAFALLVDVTMRAADHRGLIGRRSTPALWLAPLFATQRGKQALRGARIMRLVLEVVTVLQIVLMTHEASLSAGRRASAALRSSIGRLRPNNPADDQTTAAAATTTAAPATPAEGEDDDGDVESGNRKKKLADEQQPPKRSLLGRVFGRN
jgi:hypothetical protein